MKVCIFNNEKLIVNDKLTPYYSFSKTIINYFDSRSKILGFNFPACLFCDVKLTKSGG